MLVEQHYAIKFCVRLKKYCGKNLISAHAFGNAVLAVLTIKRWHQMFVDGRESRSLNHGILLLFPVGVGNHTLMRLAVSRQISLVQFSFLAHLRVLEPQNTLLFCALYACTASRLSNLVSLLVLISITLLIHRRCFSILYEFIAYFLFSRNCTQISNCKE